MILNYVIYLKYGLNTFILLKKCLLNFEGILIQVHQSSEILRQIIQDVNYLTATPNCSSGGTFNIISIL
jgi:hypothetical protein